MEDTLRADLLEHIQYCLRNKPVGSSLKWRMSETWLRQIRDLKDSFGHPLWDFSLIPEGDPLRMYGYLVEVTDHVGLGGVPVLEAA